MFDLTKTEIQDDFAPIPAGLYPAYVEKVEWKTSQNSGSDYLNVMFKVFGENYGNRVVFTILNLMHPNDTPRNIALADLKKMLLASGVTEDEMNFDSKESVSTAVKAVRCMIKVAIKSDSQYGDKNVIKGYQELDEKQAATTEFNSSSIPF